MPYTNVHCICTCMCIVQEVSEYPQTVLLNVLASLFTETVYLVKHLIWKCLGMPVHHAAMICINKGFVDCVDLRCIAVLHWFVPLSECCCCRCYSFPACLYMCLSDCADILLAIICFVNTIIIYLNEILLLQNREINCMPIQLNWGLVCLLRIMSTISKLVVSPAVKNGW